MPQRSTETQDGTRANRQMGIATQNHGNTQQYVYASIRLRVLAENERRRPLGLCRNLLQYVWRVRADKAGIRACLCATTCNTVPFDCVGVLRSPCGVQMRQTKHRPGSQCHHLCSKLFFFALSREEESKLRP